MSTDVHKIKTKFQSFIGGGAVLFSLQAPKAFINDKSPELFQLYMMIAQQNEDFFHTLDMLLSGGHDISRIVDTFIQPRDPLMNYKKPQLVTRLRATLQRVQELEEQYVVLVDACLQRDGYHPDLCIMA